MRPSHPQNFLKPVLQPLPPNKLMQSIRYFQNVLHPPPLNPGVLPAKIPEPMDKQYYHKVCSQFPKSRTIHSLPTPPQMLLSHNLASSSLLNEQIKSPAGWRGIFRSRRTIHSSLSFKAIPTQYRLVA